MSKRYKKRLPPYLSPAGAWAFSLGSAIGWGSLVVTTNTYLAQAGPLGSCLGVIIGAMMMVVIARNYHYMINRYPEPGGSYSFVRHALGYDQGFLVAWFTIITYLAMLWANATSLPLFVRYFWNDALEFGHMYTLFGYDVYFGEALLSVSAIIAVAFFCSRRKKVTAWLMTVLAVLFTVGITVCFAVAIFRNHTPTDPQFLPDADVLPQVVKIAVISPWAFIGFENISHASEEYQFETKKSFEILTISIVVTTLLYLFVILLSVSAYPPEYASWLDYIRDLPNLSGVKALPPFYAAHHYLGNFGVWALMLSLMALVLSSLIGNIFSLSRLFYAMSQDNLVSKQFAEVNEYGNPAKTMVFIVCISAITPFIGRVTIGWIVDVTTMGAMAIYTFVSIATFKVAMTRDDALEKRTGLIGAIIMGGFMIYLLGLNVVTTTGAIETSAFVLFVVWSVIGIFYFRVLLKNDKKRHLGQSLSVWVVLLSHLLLVSLVWLSQRIMDETNRAMESIEQHFIHLGYGQDHFWFIKEELDNIHKINALSVLVVTVLTGTSIAILLTSYGLLRRRVQESEEKLSAVEKMANTDPLTGLKSKHAYAQIEKTVDDAILKGTANPFAVVVCDVNGLKFINDTLGHKAGDAHIKAASRMISAIFTHSSIYRTGGDEFVVLLWGRDYKRRQALMQCLHDTSVAHIAKGTVVVSGGISDYESGKDQDIHEVFVRADALMYEEKMNLKSMGAKTRE